jgi:esterase
MPLGHSVGAEGRERYRLLERREHLHGEVRRRDPALLSRLALVNTLPGSPPGRMQPRTDAERFASRETAFAVLAARQPERSGPSLRRETLHELVQDPDGSWVWRHHPGNLPVQPGARVGEDETLWTELRQLATATALVRSDWTGQLTATDLARLRQRAPNVEVLTIPGAGEDIVATQPAALASALNQLLTRKVQQQ